MKRLAKRWSRLACMVLVYGGTATITFTAGVLDIRLHRWEVFLWGASTLAWMALAHSYWRVSSGWREASRRWQCLYEKEHEILVRMRRELS